MILFGHLGLGLKIAEPFTRSRAKFPVKWVLLGTLFPDLIDKSIYYSASWMTGLRGADLGLISGTRTFGHTALFLVLLAITAAWAKSKPLGALTLGIATHLLIDHVGDSVGYSIWPTPYPIQSSTEGYSMSLVGFLWPFLGNHFYISPFQGATEHFKAFSRPHLLIGETAGLILLLRDQWICERLWKRAYSPRKPKSSS